MFEVKSRFYGGGGGKYSAVIEGREGNIYLEHIGSDIRELNKSSCFWTGPPEEKMTQVEQVRFVSEICKWAKKNNIKVTVK